VAFGRHQPCHAAIAGRPQARSCYGLFQSGAGARLQAPAGVVWAIERLPIAAPPGNIATDDARRPLSSHCALPGRIAGVSVNARLRAARSAADLARHTYPGAALPERFLAMPRNFLQIRLLKP